MLQAKIKELLYKHSAPRILCYKTHLFLPRTTSQALMGGTVATDSCCLKPLLLPIASANKNPLLLVDLWSSSLFGFQEDSPCILKILISDFNIINFVSDTNLQNLIAYEITKLMQLYP